MPDDVLQYDEMLSAQQKTKETKMSDDNWKVGANLDFSGHKFNFRGDDVEELATHLENFAEYGDRILEVLSKVKQIQMAKGLTSFTPAPAAAPNTQNSAPAAGATAGSLRCVHGAYKDMQGKRKKNGEAYQYRYFCPKFGDGSCRAADLPGQQPWS